MSESANSSAASPLGLFELIAQVETTSHYRPMRFEPQQYARIVLTRTEAQKAIIAKIQAANACSWYTALMIYCTSWGAVQVMGFNLYGPVCDYAGSVVDYLCDEAAQRATFQRFIAHEGLETTVDQLAASTTNRQKFGTVYNGNGAAYADCIVAALHHFNVPVYF